VLHGDQHVAIWTRVGASARNEASPLSSTTNDPLFVYPVGNIPSSFRPPGNETHMMEKTISLAAENLKLDHLTMNR
jgi:hypothetical protein